MKITNIINNIDRHAIIAFTDLSGTITFVNENFCKISGYTHEELMGQNHRILNSGTHPKEFFTNIWSTILNGKVWVGDICNRKKNGELYWVNTTIAPETDEKGKVVGFFAIRYDITKQKHLEKQNAELVRINDAVQELAKIGGWEYDIKNDRILWSDQIYHIHEIKAGIPLTKEFVVNFYVDEDKLRFYKLIEHCIETGETFDDEFQLVTAKGRKVWVRATGEAVFSNNGVAEKLRGAIQDITVHKENEIRIENDRKKFLHTAKLSTLGEMSSSLIHEISNPLNVINGVLTAVRRYDDIDRIKEILNKADQPLERLMKMVINLRRFSRNETMDREIKENDLAEIIKSSLDYASSKLRSRHVEVRNKIDHPLPILCEASELEQVFVNLFNNAADAIEHYADKWIDISFDESDDGVFVYVKDSGSGIPKEIADNIFDNFFTTKDKDNGTGIGLSVVHDIVTSHGGKIYIDDKQEHTCFVLHFVRNAGALAG